MSNFLRKKIFFILAGLFLGFIVFFISESKVEKSSLARVSLPQRVIEVSGPEVEGRTFSLTDIEPLDLIAKIEEGVRVLEESPPLGTERYISDNVCFQSGKKSSRALRKEISFAILDTVTREIFEKRCWFSREDAVKSDIFSEGIDKLKNLLGLTSGQTKEDVNEELSLVVNWWNNHNSDIEVRNFNSPDEPGRYIIIGNKYPMLNDYLAYPEDIKGKKYSDIIYIPYSNALHRPELVEEGKKFLNESVTKAFNELRDAKIWSISYKGRLVADTVSAEFIKNIFITEQTDPSLVLVADDGGLRQAERVLVRLATNKEKAYRYTYSSAGALGLGQIMPATYENTARLYPAAKLIKDIDVGRVDLVNGIKASILVFDDHFATVLRKFRDPNIIFSKKTPQEIEEVKAAIYNGGPGKINAQTAAISSAVSETVNYVAKFKKIRSLELFSK